VSPRRISIGRKRTGPGTAGRIARVLDPRSSSPAASPSERQTTTVHPTQASGEAIRKGVPPEILRQVKLIELRTRGLVNSVFTGEYRSVFKGQGLEFSEVREYQPGDEVRTIDWNVTARMGRPFVKRYIEERELTVMLAVDLSGSERFGTVDRFKSELASELAAVVAMSAVRNNDRVGVVLFTDRIEYVVPPRKGRKHVLRIMRDLLSFDPVGKGTDMIGVIDHLAKTLKQKAIVFLVSDFVAADIEHQLKILAQRHDVVAVTVEDPSERVLPDIGLARFVDPETGQQIEIDTSSSVVRRDFEKRVTEERDERRHLLRRLAIDEVPVRTDGNYIEPLLKFFRSRETQARRR
jgi:uncharacterized protein (DUF58 family)